MASILLGPMTTPLRSPAEVVFSDPMIPLDLTPSTGCPECVTLRRELDAALAQIAVLDAQVKELAIQLQRNSSNSSTPPSANPLDAPRPAPRPPTGRRPGGQRGHRGHHRTRLPASRVDEIIAYYSVKA